MGSLLKIIPTIFFLALAAPLIFVHNLYNLGGSGGSYEDKTTVANSKELVQFIAEQKKASAIMDARETIFFIVFPWALLTAVLLLWKSRKSFRWKFVASFALFVVVFGIANITNQIGAYRELEEELPIWESKFQLVEDPTATEYVIEDAVTVFDKGHYGKISTSNPDGSLKSSIYFGIPDGTIRGRY